MISRGFSRKESDLMVVLDFLASYGHQDLQHGLTQKELAEATKIPEATIGPIVEQCVNQGWVAKESRTRGPGLGGTEYVIYLRQAGWAVAQPVRIARMIAGRAYGSVSGQVSASIPGTASGSGAQSVVANIGGETIVSVTSMGTEIAKVSGETLVVSVSGQSIVPVMSQHTKIPENSRKRLGEVSGRTNQLQFH